MTRSLLVVLWLLPSFAPDIIHAQVDGAGYPPLPVAVTNNAVAGIVTQEGYRAYSFMGLGQSKTREAITNRAFELAAGATSWREIEPVPGPGRIAATAQSVHGMIYVFGGYTVAPDGSERSVPDVNILDPDTRSWHSGAPIPVPVDDAVSGVWRDSIIYLVSGWSDSDNVANVQVYDPLTDSWEQATPIPGVPVFGHAGSIVGDQIIYVDGVRRNRGGARYTMEPQAWSGEINPGDATVISWSPIDRHPGPPIYRAAAGACDRFVLFTGGTSNPYNYDGRGYDGNRSDPLAFTFAYDIERSEWIEFARRATPSMDHRGMVPLNRVLATVGGMREGPTVAADVLPINNPQCTPSTAR